LDGLTIATSSRSWSLTLVTPAPSMSARSIQLVMDLKESLRGVHVFDSTLGLGGLSSYPRLSRYFGSSWFLHGWGSFLFKIWEFLCACIFFFLCLLFCSLLWIQVPLILSLLTCFCLYLLLFIYTDDILSLRNFLCNFVTFWSSQGNLSSKKNRKTEENAKS